MELQTMPLRFRVWDNFNKKFLNDEQLKDFISGYINARDGELYMAGRDYEISQDTGLKDKNGKSIYTGDIIKHNKRRGYYVVFYNKPASKIVCSEFNDSLWRSYLYVEVIGNIWQNPELLEDIE